MSFEPTFDMYGIAPPEGDWAYEVDDYNVTFGPGWWPFYRDGKPASIRVAPNTEFRSWRNEYVLINAGTGPITTARLALFVRPQGMGAMTVTAQVRLDIAQRRFELPAGLPDDLHPQAAGKAQRLLDLLQAARRQRRAGATAPVTAHERHMREEAMR